VPAVAVRHDLDILHDVDGDPEVLVVAVGAMAALACDVAAEVEARGHRCLVVDPRWVLPVPEALVALAREARLVVVIEDHVADTGITAAVSGALDRAAVAVPVHGEGLPKQFLDHASRGQVLEQVGLTVDEVTARVLLRLR
jgi:1-deoxy-D-xylulose-5-phosphate synthase